MSLTYFKASREQCAIMKKNIDTLENVHVELSKTCADVSEDIEQELEELSTAEAVENLDKREVTKDAWELNQKRIFLCEAPGTIYEDILPRLRNAYTDLCEEK